MEAFLMAARGFAAAWIFGAGYLLGCISMEVVRRSETRRAIKEAASAAGLRHVTVIENTRGDDGARLLGEIEDELHHYGVGSDTRPEIHLGATQPGPGDAAV